MPLFEVGELVRDKLNEGENSYGLGVIVGNGQNPPLPPPDTEQNYPVYAHDTTLGKRYDVYFTKFERIITFHGDYLERV